MTQDARESLLKETIDMGNRVAAFYEEYIDTQNSRIDALEAERLQLMRQLRHARRLLRTALHGTGNAKAKGRAYTPPFRS